MAKNSVEINQEGDKIILNVGKDVAKLIYESLLKVDILSLPDSDSLDPIYVEAMIEEVTIELDPLIN